MNDSKAAPVEAQAVPDLPVAPTLMDVTLDGHEAQIVWDMLGDDRDDLVPLRLLLGDGHSGVGLYAASADYPEEGAMFLAAVRPRRPTPAAADLHQQSHSDAQRLAECLRVLRPAVRGKWPHEQALEELAKRALVAASPAAAAQQSITKEQALESLSEVGLWLSRDPHALRLRQFIEQASPAAAAGVPFDHSTLPARCIRPQCPTTCDGCNHALSGHDAVGNLIADLLDTFAVDEFGSTFEDGDSKLVDRARAFLHDTCRSWERGAASPVAPAGAPTELHRVVQEVVNSYNAGFREDALWESVEKLCSVHEAAPTSDRSHSGDALANAPSAEGSDPETLVRSLLWDEHPECCGCPVQDTGGEYMGQTETVMSCCGNPELAPLNDAQIVATLRAKFPQQRWRFDATNGDPETGDNGDLVLVEGRK